MSTGEAGLPLVGSGEQIRQREFATVRRGYDPDQVRAYLISLASHVEGLERSLADAMARIDSLEAAPPPQVDPYEQLSKRFAGVLSRADTEADTIVEQARAEAARIKDEARTSAEELRVRSSRSLISAQEESDRMLANLAERREAMLRQLHDMQSRLLSVADDLEVAIQPDPRGPARPGARAEAPTSPDAAGRASPAEGSGHEAPTAGGVQRPTTDVGLAALFDDPDDVTLEVPDFGRLDLDLEEGRGTGP